MDLEQKNKGAPDISFQEIDENSSVDDSIMVVCRVRPPIERERKGSLGCQRCINVEEDGKTVVLLTKPQSKRFTFDVSAGEHSTQEEIFSAVGQPITQACLEGYNGTVFCYGQTGSGKTFTTFGPSAILNRDAQRSTDNSSTEKDPQRGLVPRVLEFLFAKTSAAVRDGEGHIEYHTKCSFYEIFNERCFDLLDMNSSNLQVREDMKKGVYVEGLSEESVTSADGATELLAKGYRHRHVGETAMNRESSRSHAVFTMTIECREYKDGVTKSRSARFNLVDLAGSERQKDTKASGDRLKEASSINQSLSALGKVINALVERSNGRSRHISYRDSKLTFLLRDSLGGNAKTLLLAAISPAGENFGETLSTLKFAQRAKMIKNKAIINEDTSGSTDALQLEIKNLKNELREIRKNALLSTRPSEAVQSAVHKPEPEQDQTNENVRQVEWLLQETLTKCRTLESSTEAAVRKSLAFQEMSTRMEQALMAAKMMIKIKEERIIRLLHALKHQGNVELSEEMGALRNEIEVLQREARLPVEAVKWKLACEEAEARVNEMLGLKECVNGEETKFQSQTLNFLWSEQRELMFNSELEEKVIELTNQIHNLQDTIALLKSSPDALKAAMADKQSTEALQAENQRARDELKDAQNSIAELENKGLIAQRKFEDLHRREEDVKLKCYRLEKQLDDSRKLVKELEQAQDEAAEAFQRQISDLIAQKEAEGASADQAQTSLAALKQQLTAARKDNTVLLQRLRALATEADTKDEQLMQLNQELETSQQNCTKSQNKVDDLSQRLKDTTLAFEAGSLKISQLTEEMATTRSSLQSEKSRADSLVEEMKAKASAAEVALESLEARLAKTLVEKESALFANTNLQDDYDTMYEAFQYLEVKSSELETSLSKKEQDLKLVTQEKITFEERAIALREQLGQALGEQAVINSALEAQLAQERDKCQLAQGEIDRLQSELAVASQNVFGLQENEKMMNSTILEQGDQLNSLREEIEEAKCKQTDLLEQLEIASEERSKLERMLMDAQYATSEVRNELARLELTSAEELAAVRAEFNHSIQQLSTKNQAMEENAALEIQAMVQFQEELEKDISMLQQELALAKRESQQHYDTLQSTEVLLIQEKVQLNSAQAQISDALSQKSSLEGIVKLTEESLAAAEKKVVSVQKLIMEREEMLTIASEKEEMLKKELGTACSELTSLKETVADKNIELSTVLHKNEDLMVSLAKETEQARILTNDLTALNDKTVDLESLNLKNQQQILDSNAQILRLQAVVQDKENMVEQLTKEFQTKTSEFCSLEKAIYVKSEELSTCIQQNEELRASLVNETEKAVALSDNITILRESLTNLENLNEKTQQEVLLEKERVCGLQEVLREKESALEQINSTVKALQEKVDCLFSEISASKGSVLHLENLLTEKDQVLSELQERNESLNKRILLIVENEESLQKQLFAAQAERAALETSLSHKNEELAQSLDDNSLLKTKLAEETEKAASFASGMFSLQANIAELENLAAERAKELMLCEEKAQNLKQMVESTEISLTDSNILVTRLQAENDGVRASLLSLQKSMSEKESMVIDLEEKNLFLENSIQCAAQKEETMKQDLCAVYTEKSLLETDIEKKKEELCVSLSENEQLKSSISAVLLKSDSLNNDLSALQQKLVELEKLNFESTQELNLSQEKMKNMEVIISEKSAEINHSGMAFKKLEWDLSLSREKVVNMEAMLKEKTVSVSNLELAAQKLEVQLQAVQTDSARLAGELESTIHQRESEIKVSASQIELLKQQLEISVVEKDSKILELQGELEMTTRQAEFLSEKLDSVQKEIQEKIDTISTVSKTEVQEMKEELFASHAKVNELQEMLNTAHQAASYTVSKNDALQLELQASKTEIRNLKMEIESSSQSVALQETTYAEICEKLKQQASLTEDLTAALQSERQSLKEAREKIVEQTKAADLSKEQLRDFQAAKLQLEQLEELRQQHQYDAERLQKKELELTYIANIEREEKGQLMEENALLTTEIQELQKKVEDLNKVNARLIGHTNTRQKIQQHQKLKDELNSLQESYKKVVAELAKQKRICVCVNSDENFHTFDPEIYGNATCSMNDVVSDDIEPLRDLTNNI